MFSASDRRLFLRTWATLFACLVSSAAVTAAPDLSSKQFTPETLASYRLQPTVFERFARATRLLSKATRGDPRFAQDPLITREIWVSGDAVDMATALQRRLDNEPTLAAALFAADISAHEYATFAIALFAARLAHGFVKSGAMRRVPAGVAADNVAFVTAHEQEIVDLLKSLTASISRIATKAM